MHSSQDDVSSCSRHGSGVAAGSMVAAMQSAGVLGLSTSTNVILGTVGAAVAAILI
ncbi:hypothetical protein ACRRTK_017697 [Alexandromys fortis]